MRRIGYSLSLAASITLAVLIIVALTRAPVEYERVPVSFDEENIPLVHLSLDGYETVLDFSLGHPSALLITKGLAARVGAKKGNETRAFVDQVGTQGKNSSYYFTSVKVGKWEFRHWQGYEDAYWEQFESSEGAIGSGILRWTNVLLNFPQQEIVFCPRIDVLPKLGVKPERMVKLPLLDSSLLAVECKTDLGVGRALISTGSTFNRIRTGQVNEISQESCLDGELVWCSEHFCLGGKDFGPIDFVDSPIALPGENFDWVIGMDFLSKHVVYIDYPNRCVYISRP